MTRYVGALGAAALTAAVFCNPAAAQAVSDFYAGKRINVIVGTSAGGTYDTYARLFAEHVSKHLPGKPNAIVTNMPGGGGVKAMNYLYNAALRDGTVLCMPEQGIPIAKALTGDPNLKFDIEKVNWIGTVSRSYYFFGVWGAGPIKSIEDAKKQEVLMSSTGRNSTTTIYPMLANFAIGTRFKPVVGYKGAGDMNMAIERGETGGRGGTWTSWNTMTKHWVQNEQIRFILQVGLQKHAARPDVPLLLDLTTDPGKKEVVAFLSIPSQVGRSIGAPPDVPAERVAALRKAFSATMKDPALIADAKKRGMEVTGESGEELQAVMAKAAAAPADLVARIRAAVGTKK